MSSIKFSLPQYSERYETQFFLPDTNIQQPTAGDGNAQEKRIKFTLNDRTNIFDWANGYFDVKFRLELKTVSGADPVTDGYTYTAADNASVICGIHSLITRISLFSQTNDSIYNVTQINRAIFLRKLLEMSPDYADSVGAGLEMWYPDAVTGAVNSNGGRVNLFTGKIRGNDAGTADQYSAQTPVLNYRIPLKWYSYFQSLGWNNTMLSGMALQLEVEIETDRNLIFRTGAQEGRVVLESFKLALPTATLRPEYKLQYIKSIESGIRWNYLRERVQESAPVQDQEGSFLITSINRPKKVFFYFLTNTKNNNELANMQHYDPLVQILDGAGAVTGGIGGNASLTSCRLELSNGSFYPKSDYKPDKEIARVYGDLLQYTHSLDDMSGGTQMRLTQFKTMNSVIYFDLDYTPDPLVADTVDFTFKYTLSNASAALFRIYCIIYSEHTASFKIMNNNYVIEDEITK